MLHYQCTGSSPAGGVDETSLNEVATAAYSCLDVNSIRKAALCEISRIMVSTHIMVGLAVHFCLDENTFCEE
ncbi:unnamed protein product [Protopolystoma xenopodis]|uniref:Uncharacterized protein n=1 Tax=Protopolystoma xenopodis TaxID=117903 RepID=A0A3S5C677_9PLAT|nr:unnamed protein product [Protopolystoma xenopodis]